MIESFELIKKHGISALCFLALWWMNARLENVEDKLYNCYDRLTYKAEGLHKRHINKQHIYAILPHDVTIKKDIKRYITA
jgi:hypothetical protein